ncbi:MAG: hypothetical protein NUV31_02580 [Dehalococcoidales bacterium]|jgi:hypothetical protein|nr:hypothetical protein [Dehalococcoidales bacterium]
MHTEQLKLSGMGEEEIQEAAITVQQSVGTSAYLHGVGYDVNKFKQELGMVIDHIRSQSKTTATTRR